MSCTLELVAHFCSVEQYSLSILEPGEHFCSGALLHSDIVIQVLAGLWEH